MNDVEFRLEPGNGSITLPTSGDPVVISLLDATGVVGTYDDVSGDFLGSFTTAPIPSTRPAPAPAPPGSTISQVTSITSPADGVTGTIDPATGEGTLTAPFSVTIYLDSLTIPPATTLILDYTCTIPTFNVTYDIVATKVPADSLNFTNLALTSQPFTVPAATCVAGPNTNPAIPQATVQDGLNSSLALPNSNATSALQLVAGAVPPPPPTTTTSIPASTTSTTTPGSTAPPPVVVQPRFAG